MESHTALGCPYCQAALEASGASSTPWQCSECGQRFAAQGQIPVLLRREDVTRLAEFSSQYGKARLREGWQPLTLEQALALPDGSPAGYPALYWQVRRQSFGALIDILAREGPSPADGPVADLGAGNGWLGYRLAKAGYQALAVDASLDQDWGLGMAERCYLPRVSLRLVQGNLEYPPLQAGQLALIVFNASLHYAADLENTLRRAARALRPGGRIIILDTPVARRPRPGTGRGDRHLGREELHEALLGAGLSPRWVVVRRRARWWLYQAKAWLRRAPRFSFPLIIADPVP
jgi:SAM-dependent methyltransferase